MRKPTVLAGITVLITLFIFQCTNRLTPVQAFEKGKLYLNKEHNIKMAYKYFKIAADKEPDNAAYQWAAARTALDRDKAYVHAKSAWENGFKDYAVLLLLVNTSINFDKPQRLGYALSLYKQLPDSLQSEEVKVDLFEKLEAFDSCLVIWKRVVVRNPTPLLCNKIAFAYGKLGKNELAYAFLLDCRKKNLLNSQGAIMLTQLLALEYDYAGIDKIVAEAKQKELYNDTMQLEYAGFMIIQNKFTEAENILTELLRSLKFTRQDFIHQQARVMLSYVYVSLNKREKIASLRESIGDTTTNPALQSERAFYTAILNLLSDSSNGFNQLKESREKLPPYPVVDILFARACAMKGDYDEAIATYKRLPDVVLRSPQLLVECARILAKNDKYDEALGLIDVMHMRKLYTRNSLELFRDITFKKKLFDKSMEAQKALESKFKDDAGIQYSSALLALKTGNKEKALQIMNELCRKYPQENRFETTRLSVYLLLGEYKKVVDECKDSKIDQYLLTSYIAQAYLGLGDSVKAEQIYEKSISHKKSLGLMLEYAQVLAYGGEYGKAKDVYKRVLTDFKDKVEKDTANIAFLYNNYAWVLLHGGAADKKDGLSYSQKAYKQNPKSLNIVDTYARALIENEKYKDCIKLLKEYDTTKKEAQLLYYLARAYENTKDINNAVRTYQDAYARADSSKAIGLEVSKGYLQKHIQELSDKE